MVTRGREECETGAGALVQQGLHTVRFRRAHSRLTNPQIGPDHAAVVSVIRYNIDRVVENLQQAVGRADKNRHVRARCNAEYGGDIQQCFGSAATRLGCRATGYTGAARDRVLLDLIDLAGKTLFLQGAHQIARGELSSSISPMVWPAPVRPGGKPPELV